MWVARGDMRWGSQQRRCSYDERIRRLLDIICVVGVFLRKIVLVVQ